MGDHTESIQIDFDPKVISLDALLEHFWNEHDPLERPYIRQYMSALFFTPEQRDVVLASRAALSKKLGREVQTCLTPVEKFFVAEDYHQKYELRRHQDLMREFAEYTPHEFVDSAAAAKLNAWVGGCGTESLPRVLPALGLSGEAEERVKKLAANRRGIHCG